VPPEQLNQKLEKYVCILLEINSGKYAGSSVNGPTNFSPGTVQKPTLIISNL